MENEQIHRDFVRKNFNALTSIDFSSEDYKEIVRTFYYEGMKKGRKISRPASKDVLELLVGQLKDIGKSDHEIHNLIDTLPVFKITGERELEKLRRKLDKSEVASSLTEEERKKVQEVGVYVAAKEGRIRTLEKEVAVQKDRLIDEKNRKLEEIQRQLNEMPSILDQEEIQEPNFDPDIEDRKTWWERFYLQADPFPRNDGLSAIDESRYESIIIKTEPFQDILSQLSRDADALYGKGFLLVGDYGYGKTTFIDYLSFYLIKQNILPIRIATAKPVVDATGFSDSFFNKLRYELRKEYQTVFHRTPEDLSNFEVEDVICDLCRDLCQRWGGIVVFMDDYHKFLEHYRQVFEFLGTLQILKDSLARAKVNLGFVVSGVPSWQEELRHNTQMMGFLDGRPIVLPTVSAELICDVFNKRIEAFCFESTPRKIKESFVRRMVSDLGGKLGIRGCINRIVEELSNNNLAIVDSPVEVSEFSLKEIKRKLEGSPKVKDALNKLLYKTRFAKFSNEQIAKSLELIVSIHVQEGIAEADQQFKENRFYFQVLRDAGLINRQKAKGGRPFQWNLSQPVQDIFRLVNKQHELSPADYLLKIYAYKGYEENSAEQIVSSPDEVTSLRILLEENVDRMEEAAVQAFNSGLQHLERLALRPSHAAPDVSDAAVAKQGLENLSLGLEIMDGSGNSFHRAGITDLQQRWVLKPGSTPEIVTEALYRLNQYYKTQSLPNLSHALKTAPDALKEIARQAQSICEELFKENAPLLHRPSLHSDAEIRLFESIREGFYSAKGSDHFDYMKELVDYLEIRFRNFFFFTSTLLFGDDYFDRCPEGIRQYAHKNIERRAASTVYENKFEGITRAQFKQIFLQNNEFREHCAKPLNLDWSQSDWELFANRFSEENIKVAHNQEKAYTPAEKSSYRRFAGLSEEIMAEMNRLVANTIGRRLYFVEIDGIFEGTVAMFQPFDERNFQQMDGAVFSSWPKEKPFGAVYERRIDSDTVDRVILTIESKLTSAPGNLVVQDLLDLDFVHSHYRVSIADFASILAIGSRRENRFRIIPWFGSSVAILP